MLLPRGGVSPALVRSVRDAQMQTRQETYRALGKSKVLIWWSECWTARTAARMSRYDTLDCLSVVVIVAMGAALAGEAP